MIKVLINEVNPCPVFRNVISETISKLHDGKSIIVGVGNGEIPDSDYKTFQPSVVIHNGPQKNGVTQILFKEEDKNSIMPYVPVINEDLSDIRYKCDVAFVCTGSEPQNILLKIMESSHKYKFKCFGMNPSICEHYCGTHFNESKLFANSKHIILPSINVPAMLFATYLGCKPYVIDEASFDNFVSEVINDSYVPKYPIPSVEDIKLKHTNFDRAYEFLKKNGATELAKLVLTGKNK